MSADTLGTVRSQVADCIADLNRRAARLSPMDMHARMDEIRQVAAANGLDALEGLMHRTSQLALLPGHRVATQCGLEHVGEALDSSSPGDRTAILAALALRMG
ncbi:hypothetical protein H8M03_09065 [Sphingomonas sabuli]|uniref:Uncharacterized protein n=1 Tax=Sphingomonas sabuli TaxID=2764186 RepID=A0A7G9L0M3_9SPHN|nr:hypothetical protein [Sphingomonas sabuli]QNM82172.1 hypothetical protein H8M03_09065 [Sphingomonas sabuli]